MKLNWKHSVGAFALSAAILGMTAAGPASADTKKKSHMSDHRNTSSSYHTKSKPPKTRNQVKARPRVKRASRIRPSRAAAIAASQGHAKRRPVPAKRLQRAAPRLLQNMNQKAEASIWKSHRANILRTIVKPLQNPATREAARKRRKAGSREQFTSSPSSP
jgi:hypothetical protein